MVAFFLFYVCNKNNYIMSSCLGTQVIDAFCELVIPKRILYNIKYST